MTIRIPAAAVLAIVLTGVNPAWATDEEIAALNEGSVEAWNAGRFEEAERLAEAAWRQAEAEWGPSDGTAGLAEVLVQMRLLADRREAAREPARRVLELIGSGAAPSLPVEGARLRLAIAGIDPLNPTDEEIANLKAALEAAENAGMAPDRVIWSGWLDIARANYAMNKWDEAYTAGDRVMNVMDLAVSVPDSARVEAAIISGNAGIEGRRFADAYRAFTWAKSYLPERVERDGQSVLNPDWASLAAWANIASAVSSILGENAAPPTDVFGLDEMDTDAVCPGVRWAVREAPDYPRQALRAGLFGAAVVEYELGADGSVQKATVATSAPDASFGEASLESTRSWRAEPDNLAGCVGQKLVATFEFAIEPAEGEDARVRIGRR